VLELFLIIGAHVCNVNYWLYKSLDAMDYWLQELTYTL
jgi:hypothetical protein